ncbi:GNAT family N-acetyltransferase [Halomarina pelagica]|uniref:GNAT family N-acetyltransferase n=1 Tax=Halomarina pelagica TaxID=2961599 RepID=UPI0020C40B09|nr:GNAT family N-acetyltransferase [Halomarina sp. BND7]
MQFAVLGWPEDGPTLRLDHRRFAYAGKFVMSNTGKAVALADGVAPDDLPAAREAPAPAAGVLAALSFNGDRTEPDALWIRYVTTRRDRRGEGIGARLVAFLVARARERGYERVRIAVNNVFAYHALSKAGFGYTGRQTGLSELVLERSIDRGADREGRPVDRGRYREGLDVYAARDLTDHERAFVAAKREAGPPPMIDHS